MTVKFNRIYISELGSESLRTMLYIVQAYLYLAPTEFISNCGEKICTRLNVSSIGRPWKLGSFRIYLTFLCIQLQFYIPGSVFGLAR